MSVITPYFLAGVRLTPISGLVGQPVKACTDSTHQSKIVQATLKWDYGGQSGYSLDMNATTTPLLDKMVMMYVDNSRNLTSSVYFVFPDTNYYFFVEPGASGYFPIFSNGSLCWAYSVFTQSHTVTTFETNIYICNFLLPAYRDSLNFNPIPAGGYFRSNIVTSTTILATGTSNFPLGNDNAIVNFRVTLSNCQSSSAARSRVKLQFGTPTTPNYIATTTFVALNAADSNFFLSPYYAGTTLIDIRGFCRNIGAVLTVTTTTDNNLVAGAVLEISLDTISL